jgi:hypothetical protein
MQISCLTQEVKTNYHDKFVYKNQMTIHSHLYFKSMHIKDLIIIIR